MNTRQVLSKYVRPRSSDEVSLQGCFHLDKSFVVQKQISLNLVKTQHTCQVTRTELTVSGIQPYFFKRSKVHFVKVLGFLFALTFPPVHQSFFFPESLKLWVLNKWVAIGGVITIFKEFIPAERIILDTCWYFLFKSTWLEDILFIVIDHNLFTMDVKVLWIYITCLMTQVSFNLFLYVNTK